MQKKLFVGYLLLIHLFLAVILIKSDMLSRIGNRLGLTDRNETEITRHYIRMVRFHARMDANVPDDAVIFIGDSLTQGLCVATVAAPSVNYGIGHDTTVGVLKRLSSYHSLERAGACVMAIGFNDLSIRGNEKIRQNYAAILQALPPHLPLVISAVLPVDERAGNYLAGMNKRITELNQSLETMGKNRPGICRFVNAGPKLADSTGNLKAAYCDNDGIHLNGAGNAIWIQELAGAIRRIRPAGQAQDQTMQTK